jgi:hypothetical protein
MCKGVEVGRGSAEEGVRKGSTVVGLAGSKGEEAAGVTPGCVYVAGWGVLFVLGTFDRSCWLSRAPILVLLL